MEMLTIVNSVKIKEKTNPKLMASTQRNEGDPGRARDAGATAKRGVLGNETLRR
jgi:hypothetical protein